MLFHWFNLNYLNKKTLPLDRFFKNWDNICKLLFNFFYFKQGMTFGFLLFIDWNWFYGRTSGPASPVFQGSRDFTTEGLLSLWRRFGAWSLVRSRAGHMFIVGLLHLPILMSSSHLQGEISERNLKKRRTATYWISLAVRKRFEPGLTAHKFIALTTGSCDPFPR